MSASVTSVICLEIVTERNLEMGSSDPHAIKHQSLLCSRVASRLCCIRAFAALCDEAEAMRILAGPRWVTGDRIVTAGDLLWKRCCSVYRCYRR